MSANYETKSHEGRVYVYARAGKTDDSDSDNDRCLRAYAVRDLVNPQLWVVYCADDSAGEQVVGEQQAVLTAQRHALLWGIDRKEH